MIMQKMILDGKEISYELKHSRRASRMRLCIYAGGYITVTVPDKFSVEKVENFALQKSDWILKKLDFMKNRNYNPVFHRHSKREYEKYKKQALELVQDKIGKFNKIYGFGYNKIYIRNSRSRWGSCSTKKNLNFNYKIVFLPENFLNYIVVHELCHLGEFNHSKRFWNLVEKTMPDYKEVKNKIRKL